jgi:triacylglycerol esterase/lipase EstA (alpha/beta hydrolase family)
MPVTHITQTHSIVAVHGLNGSAFETWTDPGSRSMWLATMLPEAVPYARVMTFGYDSTLAFSKSKAGIDSYARDLLNRLRLAREQEDGAVNRPVVFIAHSLGGIVVKKALIIAHEASSVYGVFSELTSAILFMGTPHRGSDVASWASTVSSIAMLGRGVRRDLLNSLKQDSGVLSDISSQFIHRTVGLSILTFTEQQVEAPLRTLVRLCYIFPQQCHGGMQC